MKRILAIFLAICAICAVAQKKDTYFPYPEIVDQDATLTERCNFLVYNFWDRCNIKESFSSLERLEGAFADWLSFMPYASVDTVNLAINNYLEAVAKTGKNNLVTIGDMAEKWVYSDSAEYQSEQLFLPFCKFIADSKKVGKKEKEHFAALAKVIESSGLGMNIPPFTIVQADGSTSSFGNELASRLILMLLEPGDFDSTMARTRLAADYNVQQLVGQGLLKVVALVPGNPTTEGTDMLAACPAEWTTGFLPDAAVYFEPEPMPAIFYLDARHKVLGKHLSTDQLLVGIRAINQSIK